MSSAMSSDAGRHSVTLFLCGDVMCGRGIDQILPHPGDPRLYELHMRSAAGYVELAEAASGPIARPVSFCDIWGAALEILERLQPDAGIANLETAVTTASRPWPRKAVHFRMHPANVGLLATAGIDCCTLANNHAMDWGPEGLVETLDVLNDAGVCTAGAGRDACQAASPAIIDLPAGGRILVFAFASESAGAFGDWAATDHQAGINLVDEFTLRRADDIGRQAASARRPGDVVVASIHWGSNWGYDIPKDEREFAHRLIDTGAIDIVHGHSSHHPRAIEIVRNRLVLYGCGDFLNDYEGIDGHALYRPDLTLMYLPKLDRATGELQDLRLVPLRIRRLRLSHPDFADTQWLLNRLGTEFGKFNHSIALSEDGFRVSWH